MGWDREYHPLRWKKLIPVVVVVVSKKPTSAPPHGLKNKDKDKPSPLKPSRRSWPPLHQI